MDDRVSSDVRRLLGPVRQVGYIVTDVEVAAHTWVERLGIGPWRVKHGIVFDNCQYLGTPINIEVSIASSYSAGIEIELIAQPDGPTSMYSDFAQQSGAGAQHVCFYPADYPEALDHLLTSGMDVVLSGAIGGVDFAYLGDGQGQLVEIADLAASGLASRAAHADAAPTWDGTDPIALR